MGPWFFSWFLATGALLRGVGPCEWVLGLISGALDLGVEAWSFERGLVGGTLVLGAGLGEWATIMVYGHDRDHGHGHGHGHAWALPGLQVWLNIVFDYFGFGRAK